MDIIESLRSQDLSDLRFKVINAYKNLSEESCKCFKCQKSLVENFDNWHPENYEKLNDTFKLVELLEQFGYWNLSTDSVLYTFQAFDNDKFKYKADGLNIAQAICNVFVTVVPELIK